MTYQLYSVQVGSVNFSSSFDPSAELPAKSTMFYTNMVSIVCREDILSSDSETLTKVNTLYFPIIGSQCRLHLLWFSAEEGATIG